MSLNPVTGAEAAPVGRRLAAAAMIVIAATAASRGFGYVREIAAAAYFGVGREKSAFDVAFLVPNTIQILVSQAALSAALIPVFAGLLETGKREEAWLVARTVLTLMILVLGALVVLVMAFAPEIMIIFAPGYRHDPVMMSSIVHMSRLLFPTVVILAITGVVISVLNSFDHFTLPAVAPIAWNLVIVLAIVLAAGRYGIDAMAWGVLLGTMVQLIIQLPGLKGRNGRLGWSLAWRNPHVRKVGALMLPVSLSIGLINFNQVVDVQFASFLGNGGVAAMNYAFRLYQLPESLFAIAVGTVLFPTLSRMAARNRRDDFRSMLALGLRMIFFVLIPASAFLLIMAEPLVRLAYQHGAFGGNDTSVVASALFFFALGSAFSGGSTLLTRGFFSLSRPWIPTILAVANLGINALLDWLFIKPFGLGGIPLSTSVVSALTFFVLLFLMRRELTRISGSELLGSAARVTVLSMLAISIGYLIWLGVDHQIGRAVVAQILSIAVSLAATSALFMGLAWMMKMPELKLLATLRKREKRA